MAVGLYDVLAPRGRISPDLFPGEGSGDLGTVLGDRLQDYLTEAEEKTAIAALQNSPPEHVARLKTMIEKGGQ